MRRSATTRTARSAAMLALAGAWLGAGLPATCYGDAMQVRWRKELRAPAPQFRPRELAEPLVSADGRVAWLGTSVGLVALRPADGSEMWRQPTNEPISGRPVLASLPTEGTASTWGPTLYAATLGGKLLAVEPTTGASRWPQPVSIDVSVRAALAADQRYVYAAAEPAILLAIDRGTGKPVWRWSAAVEREYVIDGQSPPVVIGNTVVFGTAGGQLVALNVRDGALVWDAALEAAEISPYGDVDSAAVPVKLPAGMAVLAASHSGGLCAIALSDGHLLWRYPAQGLGQPVVIGNAILAASAYGELHVVDLAGKRRIARKWSGTLAGHALAWGADFALLPSENGIDLVSVADARVFERLGAETGFSAPLVRAGDAVLALGNTGCAFAIAVNPLASAAPQLR